MALEILVNTGSINGVLPDGTNPLQWTNVDSPSLMSSASHSRLMFIWTEYLTHWGRDKMAAISQTTLSIAFSWI